MKAICINFNMQSVIPLRNFDFFDLGTNVPYFDNTAYRKDIETRCQTYWQPTFAALLKIVEKYGKSFKFSLSASGFVLNAIEEYCPSLLEILKQLTDSNCLEHIGMPYNHSLASINNNDQFIYQVKKHREEIERLFGYTPVSFANSELLYTDNIGKTIYDIGYRAVLVDGFGSSLDIKGSNFVYYNPLQPRLKILPRNENISRVLEDALKDNNLFKPQYFVEKIYDIDQDDDVVFLSVNLNCFDTSKYENEGVLDFLTEIVDQIMESKNYEFYTPEDVYFKLQPVAPFHSNKPVTGMNKFHDLTLWQGNELQQEALNKITALQELVELSGNEFLTSIWEKLQSSDYFYMMSTEKTVNKLFNNNAPYKVFITYMHIIDDLTRRLNEKIKIKQSETMTDQQIMDVISFYEKEIIYLRHKLLGKDEPPV